VKLLRSVCGDVQFLPQACLIQILVIRPPRMVVPEGLIFCCFFFQRKISELPWPIAVKHCHVIGNCDLFYNLSENLGALPIKISGPKTCKNFAWQIPTLIADISGTCGDIQNWKTISSPAIPPTFLKIVWWTLIHGHVSLDPPKSTFLEDHILATPSNFYTC